ncbi:MAG: hypothetical protein ABI663_03000 [Chryseolinea sp.]
MKKIIPFSWAHSMVGIALCAILVSFSIAPGTGAHSVKVYLDSKLMVEQYLDFHKTDAPKLILDPAEKYNQLIVKYSECGRTVTGRKLTLKDNNNKVLKDWRFEGSSTGFNESMTCLVKDIIALKQKGSNTLKLYYSSTEFPEGQQVVYVVINDKATTALN